MTKDKLQRDAEQNKCNTIGDDNKRKVPCAKCIFDDNSKLQPRAILSRRYSSFSAEYEYLPPEPEFLNQSSLFEREAIDHTNEEPRTSTDSGTGSDDNEKAEFFFNSLNAFISRASFSSFAKFVAYLVIAIILCIFLELFTIK